MASFISTVSSPVSSSDSKMIVSQNMFRQIDLIRRTYKADISDSGLKKLLILGRSGAGKSALCNALLRRPDSSFTPEVFFESGGPERCTTETFLTEINFLGDEEHRINLIDTIGLESNHQNNVEAIAKLVVTLKHYCDKIHLFGIVMDAHTPRLDSRIEMIHNFELVFGKETFWKNAVILFTKMPMSKKDIKKRVKIRKGESDRDYLETMVNSAMNEFGVQLEFENQRVPYFILDSKVDAEESEREEIDTFTWEADKLYMLLSEKRDEDVPNCQSYEELEADETGKPGASSSRIDIVPANYLKLLQAYPGSAEACAEHTHNMERGIFWRIQNIFNKIFTLLGLTCFVSSQTSESASNN